MVILVFLHFATTVPHTVISNSEKLTHPNVHSRIHYSCSTVYPLSYTILLSYIHSSKQYGCPISAFLYYSIQYCRRSTLPYCADVLYCILYILSYIYSTVSNAVLHTVYLLSYTVYCTAVIYPLSHTTLYCCPTLYSIYIC